MKLLFDQNLSPRLCERLRDLWTGLSHVRSVGLAAADDQIVWEYAANAVVAYDAAGNVSVLSNTAIVTISGGTGGKKR